MRLLHVLHEFHKSLHQNDTSERFFFSHGISPLDILFKSFLHVAAWVLLRQGYYKDICYGYITLKIRLAM